MTNLVVLIGNLTKDAELSKANNGTAICKFSLAVTRSFKSSDGNKETDFFDVVMYGKRVTSLAGYLTKGKKISVVGSIQNRSFEGRDGVKRRVTEIIASDIEFLGNNDKNTMQGEVITPAVELKPIDESQLPF